MTGRVSLEWPEGDDSFDKVFLPGATHTDVGDTRGQQFGSDVTGLHAGTKQKHGQPAELFPVSDQVGYHFCV